MWKEGLLQVITVFGGLRASSRWIHTVLVMVSAVTDFVILFDFHVKPAKAQMNMDEKCHGEQFGTWWSGEITRLAVTESGPASCHCLQASVCFGGDASALAVPIMVCGWVWVAAEESVRTSCINENKKQILITFHSFSKLALRELATLISGYYCKKSRERNEGCNKRKWKAT